MPETLIHAVLAIDQRKEVSRRFAIFVLMTLLEFNALDLNEKAEALWQGTFLADRELDGLTIQLYSLPGFYAELFYDHRRIR